MSLTAICLNLCWLERYLLVEIFFRKYFSYFCFLFDTVHTENPIVPNERIAISFFIFFSQKRGFVFRKSDLTQNISISELLGAVEELLTFGTVVHLTGGTSISVMQCLLIFEYIVFSIFFFRRLKVMSCSIAPHSMHGLWVPRYQNVSWGCFCSVSTNVLSWHPPAPTVATLCPLPASTEQFFISIQFSTKLHSSPKQKRKYEEQLCT